MKDKGTYIWRLKLYDKVVEKALMVDDNRNPMLLPGGELKKVAAKRGISPMLTPEEMLDELIKKLESEKGSTAASSSTSNGETTTTNNNTSTNNAIIIAKKIIELAENYDDEGIINILNQSTDTRITRTSPIAAMRKCYLKLSLLIHPDKLGRDFEHATKAFQALVIAFERLSSPDATPITPASSASGKKPLSINRSNEGCYRTIIKCPRCRVAWGDNIDGNPDYYYNFLMMGLKRFSCSTCLFQFGAITAIHYCPFCNHTIEYSPDDYHRQVTCNNIKCKKPFGFYCYSTSDRVLNNLKQEVKEELERHIKAKESKLARQARVSSRYGASSVDEELVFIKGLRDTCPRCGEYLEEYSEEDQRNHLRDCTDTNKHQAYAKDVMKRKLIEEKKLLNETKQDSIESAAVFTLLGGSNNLQLLWMLDDENIKKQALLAGVDTEGDRNKLIENIIKSKKNKQLLIEDAAATTSTKRRKLTVENLPKNIHSLSISQIQSILICNEIVIPKGATKSDLIEIIESELYESHNQPVNEPLKITYDNNTIDLTK